ncbi:hypothetical protein JET14_09555 [Martelella lutilitoris]|uniref:non-specific serine/threonine protein kinase n=1 Tax=Martelella lutilitoris TaxID=2583532 RepID=A0A7T7HNN3_9HYPH|nr:hypothetical protein [Martelella lutilitoris]QQM32352.1 hypothetical protein JET14_09555 [Martelella lutilitoris]
MKNRQLMVLTLCVGTLVSCSTEASDTSEIMCWGGNLAPSAQPPSGVKFRDYEIQTTFACGITDQDNLACWGEDDWHRYAPVGMKVKKLSLAGVIGCVLDTKDQIFCWGNNQSGQLNPPTRVVQGREIDDVFTNGQEVCAREKGGGMYCWGWWGSPASWSSEVMNLKIDQFASHQDFACWSELDKDGYTCTFGFSGEKRVHSDEGRVKRLHVEAYGKTRVLLESGELITYNGEGEVVGNGHGILDFDGGIVSNCWLDQSHEVSCHYGGKRFEYDIPNTMPPPKTRFDHIAVTNQNVCGALR